MLIALIGIPKTAITTTTVTTTTTTTTTSTTKTTTSTTTTTTSTTKTTTSTTTTTTSTTTTTTSTTKTTTSTTTTTTTTVIDLLNGSTTVGTQLVTNYINSGSGVIPYTQLWFFDPNGTVRNAAAGLVIQISGGISGTNLVLGTNIVAQNQIWLFSGVTMSCPAASKVMDIPASNAAPNTYVIGWSSSGGTNQQWTRILYTC
ncbi:unnamed protein product [Rotaria sordida]|uniref:Ricin B lectin domain-containing protein n=1 Tax=Rotaria sordida TaxID=392033 RepID=A0A819ID38_9BILA|nr:unnamed protein product [Rotaria sordida]